MEGETAQDPTLFPATVGERLRGAREAQGLDLADVAARTRIPQRHLDAIERSNYEGLPSVTYSIGFAKSYARAVGMDEVEIARALRAELGRSPERVQQPIPSYDLEDTNRVPPRGLALGMIVLVVLAMIGFGLWYGTGLFRGSPPPPETLAIPEAISAGGPGAATSVPAAGGQVSLIALDTVWLRVSDAGGRKLFEKEMTTGERYDVPAGAEGPHLRTPRPDRLRVLINGSVVAPLSARAELVDVGISAAALQARGQPAATASSTPAASASPAASALPAPRPSASPTRAPARPTPSPTPTRDAAAGNSSAAP